MPLRISRQMLLDQWNEAITFVSSTMDAKLAGGKADAGAMLIQCRDADYSANLGSYF